MKTSINPRHLQFSLAFVHNTYLACRASEKRSYWRRVIHAMMLHRFVQSHQEFVDRDFRFQRDMVRQRFCRLGQDFPGFRHFLWRAHERMLEKIDAAEWEWFRDRNVG